jgi:predicted nucleic acid-binding protein
MILVDTSVIVALLDANHDQHQICARAIERAAEQGELAVSVVSIAELAAGGRTREAVEEDLRGFQQIELDFNAAWRAGHAFRRARKGKTETAVLPDFLIRAQAATLNLRHLTNDRRRLAEWTDVDFIFPD